MMSTKRQLVVKLTEDKENLLLTSYLRLQIMKKTRNAWQTLACSPPGIAVLPPSEQ